MARGHGDMGSSPGHGDNWIRQGDTGAPWVQQVINKEGKPGGITPSPEYWGTSKRSAWEPSELLSMRGPAFFGED